MDSLELSVRPLILSAAPKRAAKGETARLS
jgi:hypothetical protein